MAFKMNGWSAFTSKNEPSEGEPPMTPEERKEYERKQKIEENIRKNTIKTNVKYKRSKYPPMQTSE